MKSSHTLLVDVQLISPKYSVLLQFSNNEMFCDVVNSKKYEYPHQNRWPGWGGARRGKVRDLPPCWNVFMQRD